MLPKLLDLYTTSKTGAYNSTKKPFNKPYFIFVVRLANQLVDCAKNSPLIATVLKGKDQK